MDIRLLGPELENVQSDARRELSETIERRQKEVEAEVLESLSELASDGKRVLKSQKPTYEMMLQLDGLVKDNEELFLRVNALCTETGVSLNAIIERMVEKNREIRAEEPQVQALAAAEVPAALEIPQAEDLDKKKVGSNGESASLTSGVKVEGLNYTLGQGQGLNENPSAKELPRFDIGDEFDPDVIKYDWQKSAFSVNPDEIVQDLPVESFAEQTFETSGMSDSEIQAAQENLAAIPEYGTKSLEEGFTVANGEVPDVPTEAAYRRVKGRRLHRWNSPFERQSALLRVTVYGENFDGRSDDYKDISVQIGNLQLNYREFTPEEDNITLDNLDQAIGSSRGLDVAEKRRLYRKLNSGAKRVERYARVSSNRRGR